MRPTEEPSHYCDDEERELTDQGWGTSHEQWVSHKYLKYDANRPHDQTGRNSTSFQKRTADEARTAITNAIRRESDHGQTVCVPIPMADILENIRRATGDWPRRIGSELFVQDGDDFAWLKRTAALIGYLGSISGKPPKFVRGEGYHSAAEVFEELRRSATSYNAIEVLPHHPPMSGVFYTTTNVRPGSGAALRELIDRFNPETEIDRDLILAMFVTPGWGHAGDRPSIGLTSSDGHGVGKTTLAKMVGRVWGGRVDVSPMNLSSWSSNGCCLQQVCLSVSPSSTISNRHDSHRLGLRRSSQQT